jgi:hypothetical protein
MILFAEPKNGVWGGWIASLLELAHLLQTDAIRAGESPIRCFFGKEKSNDINDTSRQTVDNPCRQNY